MSPKTRIERAQDAKALVNAGLSTTEVASELGISSNYVRALLLDPEGEKDRRRKESYRGSCEACGAPTSGSDGPAHAPKKCAECARTNPPKYWTRDRVLAAFHEWAAEHRGEPPSATEWLRKVEGSPGQYAKRPRGAKLVARRWPPVSIVQREFGSWAEGIEAAGFPRPEVGKYKRSESTIRKIRKIDYDEITKLTKEGKSAREIAARVGCAPGTVYIIRKKLGLKPRHYRGTAGLLDQLFKEMMNNG